MNERTKTKQVEKSQKDRTTKQDIVINDVPRPEKTLRIKFSDVSCQLISC